MSNSKKERLCSPFRKKLRFDEDESDQDKKSRAPRKHKLDKTSTSPKKRSKVNDSNEGIFLRSHNLSIIPGESSLSTTPKKGKNINKRTNLVLACQSVLTADFYDVKSRLGILTLPNCCTEPTICSTYHKNDSFNPIMCHEIQAVKISLESENYQEVLTIFKYVITHEEYATPDIMMSFVDIIMNIHDGDLPHQIILEEFVNAFYFMYNTNPPCVQKIRKNYMEFLKIPCNKENRYMCSESNYVKDIGITDFVLSCLQTEIMNTCSDGPLIDSSQFDKMDDDSIDLLELEKIKKKSKTYCTLQRLDRIKRLTLLLDIIVELLEIDLAIWLKRHIKNIRKHIISKNRPIIAFLLWQHNPFIIGRFTELCKMTIVLFIHTIKHKNFKPLIALLSRLCSILFTIFELSEDKPHYYTSTSHTVHTVFVNEIYELVKVEKLSVFLDVINNIKSKSLKYYLCHKLLQDCININEENSFELILKIFEGKLWNAFSKNVNEVNDNTTIDQMNEDCNWKQKNCYKSLIKKLQAISIRLNNEKLDFSQNEKQTCKEIKNAVNKVDLNNFMNIVYLSFKFSLDNYSIDKILDKYVQINKIQTRILDEETQSCSKEIETDQTFCEKVSPLKCVDEDCIKYYRSLLKKSMKISEIYKIIKKENDLPIDYFQNMQYFQRYSLDF